MSYLSRRSFLQSMADPALVVGGLRLAGLAIILAKIGSKVNPYVLETENGSFSLFTGVHGSLDSEVPSIFPLELFTKQNFDAVFLEGQQQPTINFSTDQIGIPPPEGFYKDLLPALYKNEVPIVTGDIPFPDNMLGKIAAIATRETSVPAAIIGSTLALRKSSGPMTRRDFLKRAAAGTLGLWGFSREGFDPVKLAGQELLRQPWAKELRTIASFTEFIHPEDLFTSFRNALIAEKLLYYVDQTES